MTEYRCSRCKKPLNNEQNVVIRIPNMKNSHYQYLLWQLSFFRVETLVSVVYIECKREIELTCSIADFVKVRNACVREHWWRDFFGGIDEKIACKDGCMVWPENFNWRRSMISEVKLAS